MRKFGEPGILLSRLRKDMTKLYDACPRNIRDIDPDIFSRHIRYCADIIHNTCQQSALLLLGAPRSNIRAYPNVIGFCPCTPNVVGMWFQFIEDDLNEVPRCECHVMMYFGYAFCDTLALIR